MTVTLEAEFARCAAEIRPVEGVSWDDMLEMYGLFKQAKAGDNKGAKPGLLDPIGRKKWEAWTSRKGMGAEAAMAAYVEAVGRALAKYRKPTAAAA